jgi:hypothetical protein
MRLAAPLAERVDAASPGTNGVRARFAVSCTPWPNNALDVQVDSGFPRLQGSSVCGHEMWLTRIC